ncbi:hypothetical protein [Pseudovibrio sp. Tun.PSC04-5.I4]|uniref:hypothetical protein n=1 Tax=Pseudovibrio sp. Tun.PSC04-5.I4 TaxID=1798213 RepID=UPI0008860C84|nr:hypothetical protein [Pseudovibrio sp. Tun.PSC04-5.I4]SDR06993.1 hypothetical protein SAMN04515695_2597 [Pseudovibrio sp. Tun.PSC04-5.I4]
MKTALCTIILLMALAYATTSAHAIGKRLGPGDKTVTFSNLSMADGSPDDGTCEKRYGTGFKTQDHPDSTAETVRRLTDKGHDILVTSKNGNVTGGVFFIETEYVIIFSGEENKGPIDVKMAATGLIGAKEASGVFSDETCRGNILLQAPNS